MKEYVVYSEAVYFQKRYVFANSEEEAKDKIINDIDSEIDVVDLDYKCLVEETRDVWRVEKL